MEPVDIRRGDSPVILGMPHGGTWLPEAIRARLNDTGQGLSDTDWHIDRLYQGLLPGATIVRAMFHRYVIDANRDPSGQSLYPGQNTTGLVPQSDFDGQPIWTTPPTQTDIAERIARFHAPYHAALGAEMARVKARHGVAVLYDCHSIRSRIPFLFDGELPDFNIGTNLGTTCAPAIAEAAETVCRAADGYRTVVNGRFRGGWTTRYYGRPAEGWHAIQMELAQSAYMREAPPWDYVPARADALRPHLRALLGRIETLALSGAL